MKFEINLGESYSKHLLLLSFFTYRRKRLEPSMHFKINIDFYHSSSIIFHIPWNEEGIKLKGFS